ncbi:MAG: hypothetical protein V1787_05155 [Candidatus Micrarchaeota archaeon]
MAVLEDVLFYGYGLLFAFAVYLWFKLTKVMQLFKFKVMQRIFYLMLISSTYVTLWLFAEILLRVTGIRQAAWSDAFTEIAVGLLLAVYYLIVKTLEEHRQELTKYDSLYYKM